MQMLKHCRCQKVQIKRIVWIVKIVTVFLIIALGFLCFLNIPKDDCLFQSNVEALSYGEMGVPVDCLPVNFDVKCSFTMKFIDGTYHVYSINNAIRYYQK